MNHDEAIVILNSIQNRDVYFKALDITAQVTQLNTFKKLILEGSGLAADTRVQIEQCIEQRETILNISCQVLYTLESNSGNNLLDWIRDSLLDG